MRFNVSNCTIVVESIFLAFVAFKWSRIILLKINTSLLLSAITCVSVFCGKNLLLASKSIDMAIFFSITGKRNKSIFIICFKVRSPSDLKRVCPEFHVPLLCYSLISSTGPSETIMAQPSSPDFLNHKALFFIFRVINQTVFCHKREDIACF